MSAVAELVHPGLKFVKQSGGSRGYRRVFRFCPTEHHVAELVNPSLKPKSAPRPHSRQYRRVCRFVSYGVDKVMEGHEKNVSMLTPGKTRYGRVSCFTASGMEKPNITEEDTFKLLPNAKRANFRHVDCFVTSGIAKGEGHLGGGTVADVCNIGFNPNQKFRQVRMNRKSNHKVERQDFNDKLKPLDGKMLVHTYRHTC